MGHSQFRFKSSGIRSDDRKFVAKQSSVSRPFGIKTPLEVGDDIFKMHVNPVRQIADNFRNLVMTNHGERIGIHDYGANLNAITFEYSNSPNFKEIVSSSIINATSKFIPSVTISNVEIIKNDVNEKNELNKLGLTKVTIKIEYYIPQLSSPKLGIEVDIIVGG